MSQLSTLSAPAADAAAPLFLNPKPHAHFVNDHKMVIRRARQMNRTWKVIIIVMSVEYISSTFTSSHTYLFLLHPRLPIYRICGEANLNNLIQLYSHAQSCFCRRTLLSSHTLWMEGLDQEWCFTQDMTIHTMAEGSHRRTRVGRNDIINVFTCYLQLVLNFGFYGKHKK